MFTWDQEPVAMLARGPRRNYGRAEPQYEILTRRREVAGGLIAELDRLATQHSVLRSQVVVLGESGFEASMEGVTFLPRPTVRANEVILPDGVLERIAAHVVGVDQHRDRLQRFGQHLKRGVLLYGPPGSGKTHTVRYLIGATPAHTVILLTGSSQEHLPLTAQLARALQPSILVLEDCDLIASQHHMMSAMKPLLFEFLDAMDVLDGDADVTFLLTTNRVDIMEEALTQRAGRVDLAAEIGLPDLDGRRRLLRLYAPAGLFSDSVIEEVAEQIATTTGSFVKELIRRAVLLAAARGLDQSDAHLRAAIYTVHGRHGRT